MPSDTAVDQRLPPISLLFGIGTAARRLLFPAVAILLFSQGRSYEAGIAIFFIPAVIASILRYVSFRYQLGDDEMIIREGILQRNERHIPYARIQNIDLIQNIVHRAFGVAVVRLETASGGRPEAVISVLTLPSVEAMREHVFSERAMGAAAEGSANDAAPLLELPLKELAIFGVISNRGMVIVAAALGVLSQSGAFENPEWIEAFISSSAQSAIAEGGASPTFPYSGLYILGLVAAGFVLLLVLLRIFSVLWAILKFYAFRLVLQGQDLRAEYGLLTKVTATIPRHRVQLVTVNLTPLHRWFGRASIQVDTAGGGGGGDADQQGVQERQWLAPVISRQKVLGLIRQVMPEARLENLDWQPLSDRAWRRIFVRWLILLLILMAPAVLLLGPWGFAVAILGLPLAILHSQLYAQRSGFALTSAAVLYRSGCWVRRLSIVPFVKMQVLGLAQTPFDRRQGMATVYVDTAGASLRGHGVAIRFLDVEMAQSILERLDHEAAHTSFEW